MHKPDEYANYYDLAAHEFEGRGGYRRIECIRDTSTTAIIAPHGGGIEPGTSEIAEAIAGNEYTLYRFEGWKDTCNKSLHIRSDRFDEPKCRAIVERSERVIAIHGSRDKGRITFVGGLDRALGTRIIQSLIHAGFQAEVDVTAHSGQSKDNICNRSILGKGVQLEISGELRCTMFEGPGRKGRERRTTDFDRFVDAIKTAIAITLRISKNSES